MFLHLLPDLHLHSEELALFAGVLVLGIGGLVFAFRNKSR